MIPVLCYPTGDHGPVEIHILLIQSWGDPSIILSMHYPDLGALPSFLQVSRNFTRNFTLDYLYGFILSLGTSVSVLGSSQASSQPSWDCWLDGNKLISNSISLNLNNVELCSLPDISPNVAPSHNLTVVASGTTNTPFLFDRIEYILDASVILDNATVVVDRSDPHIGYSGWSTSPIGIGIMATSVPGSYLVFDFIGAFHFWLQIFTLRILILCRYPNNMDNNTRLQCKHHCSCLGPVYHR